MNATSQFQNQHPWLFWIAFNVMLLFNHQMNFGFLTSMAICFLHSVREEFLLSSHLTRIQNTVGTYTFRERYIAKYLANVVQDLNHHYIDYREKFIRKLIVFKYISAIRIECQLYYIDWMCTFIRYIVYTYYITWKYLAKLDVSCSRRHLKTMIMNCVIAGEKEDIGNGTKKKTFFGTNTYALYQYAIDISLYGRKIERNNVVNRTVNDIKCSKTYSALALNWWFLELEQSALNRINSWTQKISSIFQIRDKDLQLELTSIEHWNGTARLHGAIICIIDISSRYCESFWTVWKLVFVECTELLRSDEW